MIAQEQALNYILNNHPEFISLNNLNVSYFSKYKDEFNFIQNHINTYNSVPDIVTFCDKFNNFDLLTVNETPEYLLHALIQDKQERKLAEAFNKIREKINNGEVEDAIKLFKTSQEDIEDNNQLAVTDIINDSTRYDEYIEKCGDFKRYYVKTGFKELDLLIGGWDRKEELSTVIARGGVGKSWFLFKSALAATDQGLRVGLFSGEMSASKVGYRLDTLASNISNFALTKGRIEVQNEYKKHIDTFKDRYKGHLYILEPKGGPASVSTLKSFIESYNLDILFVDQHSLLVDDHRATNPVQAASNISKDLKNLQVLKRIPIIAASQQNRGDTEESGVSLKNISQSDRIGQDSTTVIACENKDNVFKMTLIKSRDSLSNQSIRYAVDLDRGIFDYIPEEDNALEGRGSEELKAQFDGPNSEGEVF